MENLEALVKGQKPNPALSIVELGAICSEYSTNALHLS